MIYFIYILECSNNSFYTGYTTDIKRRYQEHLAGTLKCKYTRSFPPRKIAACWQIDSDVSAALKVEHQIKRLSKPEKIKLTHYPSRIHELLPADISELTKGIKIYIDTLDSASK